MPGSVARSHVEDILVCPTQRWTCAAGRSRGLPRNRNESVVAPECLFVGHCPARVGGHPVHGGDQARLGAYRSYGVSLRIEAIRSSHSS